MWALTEGRRLRRHFGYEGRVEVDDLAEALGLEVLAWPLAGRVQEVLMEGVVAIGDDLGPQERRWAVAHAIGHHLLHSGNLVYLRLATLLVPKLEREADDFAYGLLVDEGEARRMGMSTVAEVADHFGVPARAVAARAACRPPVVTERTPARMATAAE